MRARGGGFFLKEGRRLSGGGGGGHSERRRGEGRTQRGGMTGLKLGINEGLAGQGQAEESRVKTFGRRGYMLGQGRGIRSKEGREGKRAGGEMRRVKGGERNQP